TGDLPEGVFESESLAFFLIRCIKDIKNSSSRILGVMMFFSAVYAQIHKKGQVHIGSTRTECQAD
ncbi:MAG: hypothetical protein KDJ52_22530, partial [Anaerolineae bacterium]|nr:hypothetical protein [Anaerolineae bacterium]